MGNGGAGAGFASPSVGGAGAIAFDIGNSLTYAGLINNSGGFVKSGSAQLNWNSTGNAITGTIEVSAGTLNVGGGSWGLASSTAAPGGPGRWIRARVLTMAQYSATNSDSYIINGGLWSKPVAPDTNWDNYFASITMTGGTISGGWPRVAARPPAASTSTRRPAARSFRRLSR